MAEKIVITGLGIVAQGAIGKEEFFNAIRAGRNAIQEIEGFPTNELKTNLGAEIKNFAPLNFLVKEKIRNLDRSALLLLTAAKLALDNAGIKIDNRNSDKIGVVSGTTFSHLWSTLEFDKEVFKESLDFASPVLFPSTVLNATSSHVSIYFNIQGFNTTISTGYTSCLEALKYGMSALHTKKAQIVLVGCVDALSYYLFAGFHKLGYMAGIKGQALCCPFDKRRNGPILGEAACVFILESEKNAAKRKAKIMAEAAGVESCFDAHRIGKIHPKGIGLQKAVLKVLDNTGIKVKDIDYICACANSSLDMDRIEVQALKGVFGNRLKEIPMSAPKSMFGETISSSAGIQLASVLFAIESGYLVPTINYKEPDPDCDIDCVPNAARKKEIKTALISSFGPGAFNSACVIKRYS